ncbi:NAD(P)/FAD-dependent oxidoreductase [Spartinivicinus ruber]|uniref:NAD(P)/FAD-dependent oxidoreductase n=1 Tax=Spartinivicinus ruber TaxID=2683272 RepID=UPI0013D4B292|nr:NAD(P)/FAD-dependent oxidoreductase [Spartinivicinus ruber]
MTNKIRISSHRNSVVFPTFPSSQYESMATSLPKLNHKPIINTKTYEVVIVGGGLSGLTAAWQLKKHITGSILLLEKADQLGGNACSNNYHGLRYSTAGTCFQKPSLDSHVGQLLTDLELWNQWQETEQDTLVLFDRKRLINSLGEISLSFLKQPVALLNPALLKLTSNLISGTFKQQRYIAASKHLGNPVFSPLFSYLKQFTVTEKYPEVPWHERCKWTRAEMELFDSISLYDLFCNPQVQAKLPKTLLPKIKLSSLVLNAIDTTLRVECLSSKTVSAYVGLYFLVGYLYGTLVAFPGGNGFISQRLGNRLNKLANYQQHCQSSVLSITSDNKGYLVRYEQENRLYEVHTKAVIWAAPKFSALSAVNNLPEKQKTAIKKIKHHDYCVAAVFLKQPVWPENFGGYLIEDSIQQLYQNSWCRTGACIVANWQDPGCSSQTGIFTLLKPVALPDDQGKLQKVSFTELQKSAYQEASDIIAAAGVSANLITDIKLWRWNKGLVAAEIGQLKSEVFNQASRPYGGIFFANQDSVGIGNLESAVFSGQHTANDTKAYLDQWYSASSLSNKQAI